MMKTKSPSGLSRLQRMGVHAALIALCLPFIMPLIWMVSTSLKAPSQISMKNGESAVAFSAENLVPDPVKWENYPNALKTVPFAVYLRNTLVLCFFSVVGAVMSSAIVAYGFARIKFKGRDALFYLMLATMCLPGAVTMIPAFALFRWLGWYGTFLPLIVPAFCGVPFYIFLLKQFFGTIPEELSEAARIDGASEWRIFHQVMLPLAKPALATCALFQFLGTWNDFFGPLIYVNDPTKYTLAYGLQQFLASHGTEWAKLMAGACIFTIPIIILFFFAQKTFIQGIATTGSKG